MRITCPAKSLLQAAKLASPATGPAKLNPVLKCFRLDALPGRVTLSATDFECGVRAHVGSAEILREGSAVLPADRLVSILSEVGAEEVAISAEDGEDMAEVRAGRAKFRLPCLPPAEFPEVDAFDLDSPHYEIAGPTFATAIQRVSFAASKSESIRYATSGAMLELNGTQAKIVGTDTKRLALVEFESRPLDSHDPDSAQVNLPGPQSALLPLKILRIVEQIAATDTGNVQVILGKRKAMFRTSIATVETKLLEGKFPPYDRIIPKSHSSSLTVKAGDLLSRVRMAAITADDESKRVDAEFVPSSSTFKATGAATGASETSLDTPDYSGESVSIAFDPAYMTDFLRTVGPDEPVNVQMDGDRKPMIFRVGSNYLYLLMPLTH